MYKISCVCERNVTYCQHIVFTTNVLEECHFNYCEINKQKLIVIEIVQRNSVPNIEMDGQFDDAPDDITDPCHQTEKCAVEVSF